MTKHCFFPMLFKWEIETLGADSNRTNWILSPYEIFLIIFLENIYVVTLTKKTIWKITNALIVTYGCIRAFVISQIDFSISVTTLIVFKKIIKNIPYGERAQFDWFESAPELSISHLNNMEKING